MLYRKVKILGLQRSGTNYLQALIKKNFNCEVFEDPLDPFFKHAFPIESVINITPVKNPNPRKTYIKVTNIPEQTVKSKKNILFILIHKELEKWIVSIQNYPADLELKHNNLFDYGSLIVDKAKKFYHRYHYSWMQIDQENLWFIDYKLLVKNFAAQLQKLPLERKPNKIWLDVGKVPQSAPFTIERRRYYLDENISSKSLAKKESRI